MAGKMSRAKGQRAEREIVKLLQPIVDKVCLMRGWAAEDVPRLERNLMQSHRGGHDIVGLEWLALEVKHQENFSILSWWEQATLQAKRLNALPVLCYRKNNVPWRFRLIGKLPAGAKQVSCPVDIDLASFLCWFEVALADRVKDAS